MAFAGLYAQPVMLMGQEGHPHSPNSPKYKERGPVGLSKYGSIPNGFLCYLSTKIY